MLKLKFQNSSCSYYIYLIFLISNHMINNEKKHYTESVRTKNYFILFLLISYSFFVIKSLSKLYDSWLIIRYKKSKTWVLLLAFVVLN